MKRKLKFILQDIEIAAHQNLKVKPLSLSRFIPQDIKTAAHLHPKMKPPSLVKIGKERVKVGEKR